MRLGEGTVLHVDDSRPTFRPALCGRDGEPTHHERDVDARAVRIGRFPVCATCRGNLGAVPPPALASEPKGDT